MKKIFCASLIVMLLAGSALAAGQKTSRVGFLTRLNISEEEFGRIIQETQRPSSLRTLSKRHDAYNVKFYDSLTVMLMALGRSEIDEAALPETVAEYLVKEDRDLEVCCVARTKASIGLALGVKAGNTKLAERFNEALLELKADWTLAKLQGAYIFNKSTIKPVKFDTFKGAETLRVAVTGDLPPIDYVDASGKPSGFNAALLAELGRKMRVNMKLVNLEANARASALASGRVDAVFWFETSNGGDWNYDAPEGVILSEPYYLWSKFLHVRERS